MRAYTTIRFTNQPDVQDIKAQGRASHVGQLPGRNGEFKSLTRRPQVRKAVRRYMKHVDNRNAIRFELMAEEMV